MTEKSPLNTNIASATDVFTGYQEFLGDIKVRVRTARIRAALAVNKELVLLYWQIGDGVSRRMKNNGWGAKVIDRLAGDLRREFPDMKGFSPRNLRYMRSFAESWPGEAILQQAAAKIPWFHHCILLDKTNDAAERLWYVHQTIEHGWSRNILALQIGSKLYHRQGKGVTNFDHVLPAPQSDLARQLLKDPYNFEFLSLQRDAAEREVEKGLIEHIRRFLLELGAGFAFLGSQYHLEFDDEDYYLDLLFYHVKLHCYVIIDLKTGRFRPEYAGKMNFYLAVADNALRGPQDAPTIGLILCRSNKQMTAEYALRNMGAPIGVSEYQITETLPENLKGNLPTVEQLEAELAMDNMMEQDDGE